MPQYKRKPTKMDNDIFKSMFGMDIPGYVPEMTKADSIKGGLLPRETEKGVALKGLVEGGLMTPATADSILGGIKKFPVAKEQTFKELMYGELSEEDKKKIPGIEFGLKTKARIPSEKEVGISGLLSKGSITKAQADSMRSGLKLGKEAGVEEEKFGVTPWYLSDKWRDTDVGKSALGKSLKGGSVEDKIRFWTYIQQTSTNAFGKPINNNLFNRAQKEIDGLLKKQSGGLMGTGADTTDVRRIKPVIEW